MTYHRIQFENGLKLVFEQIPYLRSVAVGIWVKTGSRNEDRINNGISHFIEHMLFKGTKTRSARDIADAIDSIGGQINAFTGKECTCFYTKTLDTHLEFSLELLSDMLFNSVIDEKDVETEKGVIEEEINMYLDTPDDLVHDLFSETVFPDNPLGFTILGEKECVREMKVSQLKQYIQNNYLPQNTVISVAGNFDEKKLEEYVIKFFGGWSNHNSLRDTVKASFIQNFRLKEKDTEQIHLCIGYEGLCLGNEKLYPLMAVNSYFGGSMSSNLFQVIREQAGLVYSIFSFPSSYMDTGTFTVYAGMNPKHVKKVVYMIMEETGNILKYGMSGETLVKIKEQLKSTYILGLESTGSRMNSIGRSELLLGYINTPDQIIDKIDKIKSEDIKGIIEAVFRSAKISASIVGNLKDTEYNYIKDLIASYRIQES